jgi:hypothetical protein
MDANSVEGNNVRRDTVGIVNECGFKIHGQADSGDRNATPNRSKQSAAFCNSWNGVRLARDKLGGSMTEAPGRFPQDLFFDPVGMFLLQHATHHVPGGFPNGKRLIQPFGGRDLAKALHDDRMDNFDDRLPRLHGVSLSDVPRGIPDHSLQKLARNRAPNCLPVLNH